MDSTGGGHMHRVSIALMVLLLGSYVEQVASKEQSSNAAVGVRARSRSPLEGVWKIVEVSSRLPGADWTAATPPYLSIYIFTPKHYSYMFAPGVGPRRLFAGDPNEPSAAEKIAAYESIVAGSGTYTLEGTMLSMTAIIHKNPSEMTGEPLRYSLQIESDRMTMTIANPPFAPGRERRTMLARIE
jgi:hypothetical protein